MTESKTFDRTVILGLSILAAFILSYRYTRLRILTKATTTIAPKVATSIEGNGREVPGKFHAAAQHEAQSIDHD
jgi:hypothetical protein